MTTAQWMADPAIQGKTVEQLVLPGTHDSGTYSLTYELSQIQYPDIAFLWQMMSGQAPAGFPSPPPFYLGPELYNFVFQIVMDVSRAQDQSTLQQLDGGIRYFDLRVYWDTDKEDLYVQHGLRGHPLSEMLRDVGEFVRQAGGKELILLQVSHTNFGVQTLGPQKLVDQLEQYIGPQYLYTPADWKAMATSTLSSITGSGSRAVVLNTDGVHYPDGSPVLTTPGFQGSGRGVSGVNDVSELTRAEQQGLAQARTGPLYGISWTLTTQVSDIVGEAISRLQGNPPQPVLKNLALRANAALQEFIDTNSQYSFNLITVDWYEDSPVVEIAIQKSGG